jgi:hypothetical protein
LNFLPHGVKFCVKAYVNGLPHNVGRLSHAAGRMWSSSHNGFEVVEGGANVCLKLRRCGFKVAIVVVTWFWLVLVVATCF